MFDFKVSEQMSTGWVIFIIIVVIVVIGLLIWWLSSMDMEPASAPSATVITWNRNLARGWESHIDLTRAYITEAVNNLPSAPTTLALLMQNQVDIGNNAAQVYGKTFGDQYTKLLQQHIAQAGTIVNNAVAGKDNTAAVVAWRKNGDDIVALLVKTDPRFNATTLSNMWNTHLDLTIQEATQIINKQYPASAQTYNQLISHANMFSSYFGDIAQTKLT